MSSSAKRLTTIQARQQFSEVCSTIHYGAGGRVIVQRRGTDFVAIIPIVDFVRLEALDAIGESALMPAADVTPLPGMPAHSELWHLLHRLWTKAVGTPGYDKREWLQLERVVLEIEKAAERKP